MIMKHAMSLLLAAISALTLAAATPAMALNPQPLPPGAYAHGGAHDVSAFALTGRSHWNRCPIAMCRR
jgi:hypothetical protein